MTATETAQQAAEIASKLSPKHREIITDAWSDGRLMGNGNTLRALERKGLSGAPISYRDGSTAYLTDLGHAVHEVLKGTQT